jgi:hypothetical protein
VGAAAHLSLAELRAECARAKAAAGADLEARRRRIQERRSLRDWTDAEGTWHLHMRHNPETGAQLMAALARARDRLFHQARTEGRRKPIEACAADALVDAVCPRAEGEGPNEKPRPSRGAAKVIVRVDLPALLRGRPIDGETCEVAGFGPVAVSAVRDLLDTADPFLAAVVTAGEAVVGVAHMGRRPGPLSRQRWSGCTPPVPPGAAAPPPARRSTTASSGPRAASPFSTCSTGCAPTTTASRPSTGGRWWRDGANGPSSLPTIPATRPTPTTHQRPPRAPGSTSDSTRRPLRGRGRRAGLPHSTDRAVSGARVPLARGTRSRAWAARTPARRRGSPPGEPAWSPP